jgi:hypothetical protein
VNRMCVPVIALEREHGVQSSLDRLDRFLDVIT